MSIIALPNHCENFKIIFNSNLVLLVNISGKIFYASICQSYISLQDSSFSLTLNLIVTHSSIESVK